jgi:hypothetical protein
VTEPREPTVPELTCDEVRDLAPSFVLGALDDDEMAAVREHLATCADPHAEIEELGGVIPVLQAGIRPVAPPDALKGRIMAAAAADLDARRAAAVAPPTAAPTAARPVTSTPPTAMTPAPVPAPATTVGGQSSVAEPTPITARPSRQPRLGWVLGLAAVLAIVLLGAWNLSLQSQLNDTRAYQQQVASVLDAARRPGALTAVMSSESPGGPSGIAAVTTDGVARIAMRDLDPTSGSEVYEGWVIVGEAAPVALGGFQVGSDGTGFLEADGLPTDSGIVLALTLEPGPGATAPSSTPVSTGTASASG